MISASMVKELRETTGAGMLDCKKALEETNGNMEEAITWLREKGISKAAKKANRIAAEGLAYSLIDGNKAVIIEVNSETDFVAKNDEFKNLVHTLASVILENNPLSNEEVLSLEVNGSKVEDLLTQAIAKIGEKLSFRRFTILEKTDDEVFSSYAHMGGKIVTLVKLEGKDEEAAKDIAMHVAAMRPLYLNKEEVPTEVLEKEKNILREQAQNEGLNPEKIDMIINGRINKYYEEVCLEDQAFIKENKMKVSAYVKNKASKIITFVRYEVGEGMEKKEEDFASEVMKQISAE